jgi:hypothetical protein
MDRNYLLSLCMFSVISLADNGVVGQSNNASNGFSNAAIADMTNTQVNMNSQASAKYGQGIECPQAVLTVAPYGAQTSMSDGNTGQTMGVAVGVAIPLGDGGTCMQMAHNVEHEQENMSHYEQIKLCIEMAKNHVTIDAAADPELYNTCRSVHINR